jgi:6-phosphogluconolactonase
MNRRPHHPLGAWIAAIVSIVSLRAADPMPAYSPARDTLVYVGTYTQAGSKGIYQFRLQTQNDEVSQNILLVPMGLAVEAENPSFLAVDPKRRLVFAVNETNTFEGQPTGAVSAYAVDSATGRLALINQQPSGGRGPCHLVLDPTGRNLLVANYGSGSVSVIRVEADGRLGPATAKIQHTGRSVHPQRQTGPHAHCVTLDPTNRFAFVCDLGLDQVLIYRFDPDRGTLAPAEPAFATLKPGAGPRHMAFGPEGRFAYVLNELDSTITVFAHDGAGRLQEVESVPTLPPYFDGRNSTAEIAVLPNGKYLFASNRGFNSVAQFEIDPASGRLRYVEEQATGGKTPRHFGIDPNSRHLAVGNQDSNTILICRIDEATGRLKPSGVLAEAPSPACIVFLPPVAAGR